MKVPTSITFPSVLLAGFAFLLTPVLGVAGFVVGGVFLCIGGISGMTMMRRFAEEVSEDATKVPCPNCEYRNRPGPTFCRHCDTRLVA